MRVQLVINKLLDVVFPQHLKCHSCGREAEVNSYGICEKCESELLYTGDYGTIQGIDGFTSGIQYNATVRRAMIPFKYYGELFRKEFLTHFMSIPDEWSVDCIVPVPLHEKRLKSRGYNQSAVLAKVLSERYGIPMRDELLSRVKDTKTQTMMTEKERIRNVKNAFRASEECRDACIVLVDDVRTTGSTLKECALELKRRGAKSVYAVTACCAMEERHSGE